MQKSHVVVDQYMYVYWTPSSVCLFQIPTVTNEGCHFMLLYIEKKAHTFFELCYHVPKVNKKPIRNCSHTYSSIIELFISRIIVIESVYGLNSLVNTFILVQYCTGFSDRKLSKVNDYRPGQANCKFQLSMLLMKNPQFWCNLTQTFSDWPHHEWVNFWKFE